MASTRDSFIESQLWPIEAVRAEIAYCLRLQGLDAQFCLDRELCEAKHRALPFNSTAATTSNSSSSLSSCGGGSLAEQQPDGNHLLETLLNIAVRKVEQQPSCSLLCLPKVGEAFELVIALEKAKRHRENRVKVPRETLTNYQKGLLPIDGSGNVTSVGSFEHTFGTCRPCAFHDNPKKNAVCCNGIMCAFCHYPHILRRKPKGGVVLSTESVSEAPRWLISAANCVAAVVTAIISYNNIVVNDSESPVLEQTSWSEILRCTLMNQSQEENEPQLPSLSLLSSTTQSTMASTPFYSLPEPPLSFGLFSGGSATAAPSSGIDFVPSPTTVAGNYLPEFNSDFDPQQLDSTNLAALVQNLVNKLNTDAGSTNNAAATAAAEVLLTHIPQGNN